MPTETQKTIAGLLLVGGSMLTGNAVLITVAGGVGVNLTSEGLAGLWGQVGALTARGTPLARAGERAIRRAVETLRRDYLKEYGRTADTRAFDLVRDCAGAVLDLAPDLRADSPLTAQQALVPALGELLHGHEPRQVERLQRELLPAVAEAFRDELAADSEAWARYHGWLIEHLTAQSAALAAQLADLPAVLDALRQQPAALAALRDALDALEVEIAALRAALERLAAVQGGAGTTFDNTNMWVGGLLNQAGNNLYQNASYVQVIGSASMLNGAVNMEKRKVGGTEYISHEQMSMPSSSVLGGADGGMLAHLVPDIQRIPHGSAAQKQRIIAMVVQLGLALSALPDHDRQEVAAVAELVADLITKAGRPQLNPTSLVLAADGLERAALLLRDSAPLVGVYAGQVGQAVRALGAG